MIYLIELKAPANLVKTFVFGELSIVTAFELPTVIKPAVNVFALKAENEPVVDIVEPIVPVSDFVLDKLRRFSGM